MAKTFAHLKKFDLSLEYYLISLEIDQDERNYSGLCDVHVGIGILQRSAGNIEQALIHYNKVLDLAQYTSKADDFRRTAFNNIGNLYLESGNYTLAKENLLKSIEFQTKKSLLTVTYNNLGQVFSKEGNYIQAWEYFKKSIEHNSFRVGLNELNITNAALREMYTAKSQPDSLLYYTMKINDLAMPVIEAKEKLTSDDEKMALLTKYQDYQVLKAKEEQRAQLLNMTFWIVLFAVISGILGYKLWKIYAYHAKVDKHRLLRNSSEMVYLLDLFKNEKDELKRMMDQKL